MHSNIETPVYPVDEWYFSVSGYILEEDDDIGTHWSHCESHTANDALEAVDLIEDMKEEYAKIKLHLVKRTWTGDSEYKESDYELNPRTAAPYHRRISLSSDVIELMKLLER
jgi:hypothetical protein